MSTDRTQRLSPGELALKLACREAIKAAGGQEFVGAECGRTQSRISDYLSPNTREFMPIDVVSRVEALSVGAPGHPHISRALGRAQHALLTLDADQAGAARSPASLGEFLGLVAGESGDLIKALATAALLPGSARVEAAMLPTSTRRAITAELDQLIDVLAALNAVIAPPPEARADSS